METKKNLHEFNEVSGSSRFQKFHEGRKLQFSINNIQMKFTDKFWLGKGLFKQAFEVSILSGEHAGKTAALLIGHTAHTKEEFDTLMKIQSFAGNQGFTNKVYTWNYDTKFGPVSVVELLSGIDLCKIDINEEQQIKLLLFILKMSDIGLTQADENCGNFIYQSDNTWITIDDIGFYVSIPKHLNSKDFPTIGTLIPPKIKLYQTIQTIRYIQNLVKKPLKLYCMKWLKENPIEGDEPKEDEIKTITIEPNDPSNKEFYDKVNSILTAAYTDFQSKYSVAQTALKGGKQSRKKSTKSPRNKQKLKKTLKKYHL